VLPSLVIMLREGIEAALVVGIVVAYLGKVGRGDLNRWVYTALGAAVAACVGLAVIFERVGLDPDNPRIKGIVLTVAGLFVITMVLWMWRAARGLARGVEARLDAITQSGQSRVVALALFGFTFVMVLREGIEAVLFLKATAIGQQASGSSFAGAILGLTLATLFAVLFIRGSVRINLVRFFRYTSIALLVLAAKLLLGSVHEFAELGLLPLGTDAIDVLGRVVEGTIGGMLTSLIIAVPLFLLLWETSTGLRRRILHPRSAH
jgi:high-affinity iron transporter